MTVLLKPEWRNGRRSRLKICRSLVVRVRVSPPAPQTNESMLDKIKGNTVHNPTDRLAQLKKVWIRKITTQEQALELIKDISKSLLGLAALQAMLGLFIGLQLWIGALIYAVLVLTVWQWHSRVGAVVLMILNVTEFVLRFIDGLDATNSTSTNQHLFLNVVLIWMSIRLLQATFKLHSFGKQPSI